MNIDLERMKIDHAEKGFAFMPQDTPPASAENAYGEASISIDHIRQSWPEWDVVGIDNLLQDPFQMIVFLKPHK